MTDRPTDDLLRSLDELGAELKVRDRPEHRAWNRLAPTKSGWTTRLYDDQAFTLWRDIHTRFPDDLRTTHHLAIMHHARAIDLEQSDHPARSDLDWRTALALWHELYESDAFWAELATGVDLAPELLPQVRQEFAERLLRLHFDIALDEQSPHNRGRFHVQLALGSPFPPEVVEQVRIAGYERATGDIDAAVWAPGTVEPEALWPAIDRIKRYLDLDDNCGPALADLGKLLTKVQVGLVYKANGIPDKEDASQVLDEIRTVARKYDPYVRRTERALLAAPEPDELALSDLASWFGRVGQACNVRLAYDEAAKWYDRARAAARAGDDDREQEYRAEVAYATVLAARDHVDAEPERAKELLRAASKSNRLPALVLMMRGRTWLLVDELDKAEQDADRAAKALDTLADVFPSFSGADAVGLGDDIRLLAKHIKDRRVDVKAKPHLDRADALAKQSRWTEAIRELDTVLAMDGDHVPALVHRADCLLGEYELDRARTDIDRAERVLRAEGASDRSLAVVRDQRRLLTEVAKRVAECGGPAATRLHREGVTAFKDDKHGLALTLLRRARAAAVPGPTATLDEDLALCLNTIAITRAEQAVKSLDGGPLPGRLDDGALNVSSAVAALLSKIDPGETDAAAVVLESQHLLEEAARLSSNRAIKDNLTEVVALHRRLRYGV